MPRKSICFLTDFMVVGGLEKIVCQAIDYLHHNYDITVYAVRGGVSQEIADWIGEKATIITRQPKQKEIYLLAMPVLGGLYLRKIVTGRFDYLIVLRPWFLMAVTGRIAQKVIFWNHSDKDVMYATPEKLNFLRKINKVRLKFAYKRFAAVWVVNDFIKEKLEKAFAIANISVLTNIVDHEEIKKKAEAPIEKDIFLNNGFNFVSVSRLSEEKAQMRLLEAMCSLRHIAPCRLLLVGDGADRNILMQYVVDNGLQDSVFFLGEKDNPYPYIKQADALVLPSKSESFGIVLLEAMALKTLAVTTDTVGGRFLSQNGTSCVLTENSAAGVFRGMRDCLMVPDLAEKFVEPAYRRSLAFEKDCFNSKIDKLLQTLN